VEAQEKFIVLLRHGIAEPHGAREDDDARILTKTGNRRMKHIGRGLAEIFPKAEAIYSSALIRCIETAEWVEKAYGSAVHMKTTDALKPDATIDEFRTLLAGIKARHFICVGHEPHLSKTMRLMTKLQSGSAIELKKGGCYGVRIDADGTAHLEWMLPPRVLRSNER
jgi:phosphohistidine phosphatase SixA